MKKKKLKPRAISHLLQNGYSILYVAEHYVPDFSDIDRAMIGLNKCEQPGCYRLGDFVMNKKWICDRCANSELTPEDVRLNVYGKSVTMLGRMQDIAQGKELKNLSRDVHEAAREQGMLKNVDDWGHQGGK